MYKRNQRDIISST